MEGAEYLWCVCGGDAGGDCSPREALVRAAVSLPISSVCPVQRYLAAFGENESSQEGFVGYFCFGSDLVFKA